MPLALHEACAATRASQVETGPPCCLRAPLASQGDRTHGGPEACGRPVRPPPPAAVPLPDVRLVRSVEQHLSSTWISARSRSAVYRYGPLADSRRPPQRERSPLPVGLLGIEEESLVEDTQRSSASHRSSITAPITNRGPSRLRPSPAASSQAPPGVGKGHATRCSLPSSSTSRGETAATRSFPASFRHSMSESRSPAVTTASGLSNRTALGRLPAEVP